MQPNVVIVVGDRFSNFAANSGVVRLCDFLPTLDKDDAPLANTILIGQGLSDPEICDMRRRIAERRPEARIIGDTEMRASRELTHKNMSKNIMISLPVALGDGFYHAELAIDDSNEVMEDHQTGQHIQGMALMEAARQMWTAVTERYLQPESTGRRFVIDVVNTTFLRFVFPVGGYIRYRLMNKTVSVVETVYDCQIEIAQGDATRATIEARYRVIDERVGEKQEALAARHTIRTLLGQTNALGSSGGRAL